MSIFFEQEQEEDTAREELKAMEAEHYDARNEEFEGFGGAQHYE